MHSASAGASRTAQPLLRCMAACWTPLSSGLVWRRQHRTVAAQLQVPVRQLLPGFLDRPGPLTPTCPIPALPPHLVIHIWRLAYLPTHRHGGRPSPFRAVVPRICRSARGPAAAAVSSAAAAAALCPAQPPVEHLQDWASSWRRHFASRSLSPSHPALTPPQQRLARPPRHRPRARAAAITHTRPRGLAAPARCPPVARGAAWLVRWRRALAA